MEILTETSASLPASVATLGTFDGVHLGHKSLIASTVDRARRLGVPSVVITFDVLPKAFFANTVEPHKLMTTEEKCEAVARCGADYIYIIHFDDALAQLSPEEFLLRHMVERLGVRHFVMGFNHRFGHGNYPLSYYDELCLRHGIASSRVERLTIADGMACSSSEVRSALRQGDVARACAILGREYTVTGKVVRGDGIGRQLGYPTANVQTDSTKIVPAEGVYEARALVNGKTYKAAAFVGRRATLDCDEMRLEVYILNFSADIYGNLITLSFVDRIRGVKHFANLSELKEQIKCDVAFFKKGKQKV